MKPPLSSLKVLRTLTRPGIINFSFSFSSTLTRRFSTGFPVTTTSSSSFRKTTSSSWLFLPRTFATYSSTMSINTTVGKENIPPSTTTTTTTTRENEVGGKPLINLLRGWPNPSLLPVNQLKKVANKVLTERNIWRDGLEYGPDPGYEPLRRRVAEWTGRYYGMSVGREEICITGGASQNLACLLSSFSDAGYTRRVWMAAPCYFLACPIFEDAGLKMRAVKEDEEGMDTGELRRLLEEFEKNDMGEHKAIKSPGPHRKHYRHLIYLVPTCSNPSGKTMSLKRRKELVLVAREFNALVICDDVYDFLQWPVSSTDSSELPPLLPRLSDIDASLGPSRHDPPGKFFGHAVSNGSFSKLAGPGTRTGWTHATADFVLGLSQTGATRSGGAASQLVATMLSEMLENGELDRWLTDVVRPGLKKRHGIITRAIKEELMEFGCEIVVDIEVFGGYFCWVKLPEGKKAKEVADMAKIKENLIVAEGPLFEVAGDEDSARFGGNLRLCFSWEEEGRIVEGVKRLARVLKGMERERRTEIVGLEEDGGMDKVKRGRGICYGQEFY
ncbi:putative aminotransferase [Podospora fimiseda]|uniref:Aminotransferase n=1 Tax=Podospora fimiseda TaxID=252190 RepID=A0AAN6YP50_9PEZI|nr:putative aminotransferase [Podospora fimiseda]